MQCTSPLYRLNNLIYEEGKNLPSFIRRKKIIGYKDFNYFVNKFGVNPQIFTKFGCGQCLSCRILYAKQWAERCYLESLSHSSNYFVTLTYDDMFVPYSCNGYQTLVKEHFQKFMKDLRNHLDYKVRFFAVGEYGDITFRPHYHTLLFGLELNDLTFYKQVFKRGNIITYFNSEFLSSIWKKGFVVVSKSTPETCAYCARYSLKKVGFKKSVSNVERSTASDFDLHNELIATGEIEPIFSLMSRRPGIARDYFEENKYRIYINDNIPDSKLKSLRYFDKLFKQIDTLMFDDVAAYRESTIDVWRGLEFGGYDEEDFYNAKDLNLKAQKQVRELG